MNCLTVIPYRVICDIMCLCMSVCVCVCVCVYTQVVVCVCVSKNACVCVCMRVSDQNGISLLYIMLKIHHSGREPSVCFHMQYYSAVETKLSPLSAPSHQLLHGLIQIRSIIMGLTVFFQPATCLLALQKLKHLTLLSNFSTRFFHRPTKF